MLDGVPVGSFTTNPAVPVATNNGTSKTVVAERISGVRTGTHTLVITDIAGELTVLGVGTPPAVPLAQHPIVLTGAVPLPLQGSGDSLLAPGAAYTADMAAISATSTLR